MIITPRLNMRKTTMLASTTFMASMPLFAVWAALVIPQHVVRSEGTCDSLRNSALAAVPTRMELSASMKTKFDNVPLVALNLDETDVIKETPIAGQDAILNHTEKYGSVCFVVRRPG